MTSVGIMASAVQIAAGTDVLLEPFNNFTFAPWTTSTATIVTGRNGSACEFAAFSNGSATYTIPTPSQSNTLTFGFAFRVSVVLSMDFVTLGGDANATTHNRLHLNSDGSLNFTRGASGIGTTAAGVVTTNTWVYLEVQVKLDDTTGFVVMRKNGVDVLNVNPVDTRNGGTLAVYDTVKLGGQFSNGFQQYDDLYITTGGGAPFKGDITVP